MVEGASSLGMKHADNEQLLPREATAAAALLMLNRAPWVAAAVEAKIQDWGPVVKSEEWIAKEEDASPAVFGAAAVEVKIQDWGPEW